MAGLVNVTECSRCSLSEYSATSVVQGRCPRCGSSRLYRVIVQPSYETYRTAQREDAERAASRVQQ